MTRSPLSQSQAYRIGAFHHMEDGTVHFHLALRCHDLVKNIYTLKLNGSKWCWWLCVDVATHALPTNAQREINFWVEKQLAPSECYKTYPFTYKHHLIHFVWVLVLQVHIFTWFRFWENWISCTQRAPMKLDLVGGKKVNIIMGKHLWNPGKNKHLRRFNAFAEI